MRSHNNSTQNTDTVLKPEPGLRVVVDLIVIIFVAVKSVTGCPHLPLTAHWSPDNSFLYFCSGSFDKGRLQLVLSSHILLETTLFILRETLTLDLSARLNCQLEIFLKASQN